MTKNSASKSGGTQVTTGYGRHGHAGPIHVFDVGTAEIWAGSAVEIDDTSGWDLIISLSSVGAPKNPVTYIQNDGPEASFFSDKVMKPYVPPRLKVEWPDRGVPHLNKEWWHEFVNELKGFKGKVAVHCQGGHGRTGTFLAIVGTLCAQIKGDHVKWVRKHYCDEAVESNSQLDYIELITGVLTEAECGNFSYGSSGGWQGGSASNKHPSIGNATKPVAKKEEPGNNKTVSKGVDLDNDDKAYYSQWKDGGEMTPYQMWMADPDANNISFTDWWDKHME